jgi:mono/diheme cytochrome c family protein
MTKLLTWGAGGLLSVVFAWSAMAGMPGPQQPPRADYSSGAYLYRAFCATCHGETGKGDGPVADIAGRRPADLTLLSRNHGGKYPRDHVLNVLENVKPLTGHEPPAMPNWRNLLRTTEGGDARVARTRLVALADHVGTLQQK